MGYVIWSITTYLEAKTGNKPFFDFSVWREEALGTRSGQSRYLDWYYQRLQKLSLFSNFVQF